MRMMVKKMTEVVGEMFLETLAGGNVRVRVTDGKGEQFYIDMPADQAAQFGQKMIDASKRVRPT